MGAPLYIINHTRKECIGFCGSSISSELKILLPFYIDLILSNKWLIDDNIIIDHISGGLEYQQEEYEDCPYKGYICIKSINWQDCE